MFSVQVLGSSSAMPLHGRHHSAHWVVYEGLHFLVDCGEAAQNQALRYGLKLHRLQAILVSHLHADHVAGVGGLLTTLHMQSRQKPLYLWGPVGLRSFVEAQLQGTFSALRYPLFIRELLLPPGQRLVLWETPQLLIEAFPLRHGVPAVGYVFREKERPRRLNRARLQELGLPETLIPELRTQGEILYQGQRYRWEDLTLPPPPPRAFAYCSDTLYDPALRHFVSGVTVLYHEATFLTQHAQRARETFHATAHEAALLAREAGVQRLLIGHFSTRYRDVRPLLDEARATFPETYLAEEGKLYPIGE
ncbi:MAG: ribonuclease Z [Bacteroidetes bacterium]|nr:MAG: ribonuclease Z [Bacteroidota bacterium]